MRLSACEEQLEFGPLMGRLHKFFRGHLKACPLARGN
jgi:hypothetical protein